MEIPIIPPLNYHITNLTPLPHLPNSTSSSSPTTTLTSPATMAGGGGGGGGGGKGVDLHLPVEILAVMPTDPYEQLDLARKITGVAIAARVGKLEVENSELADKLAGSESVVLDLKSQLRVALDENAKLVTERDTMSATIKKLTRDLAKLETFKRQLMQSLNDDSSTTGTVDSGVTDQSVTKTFVVRDEGLKENKVTNNSNATRSAPLQNTTKQKVSMSPYITPRLTPSATPKMISTAATPKVYSTAASPHSVSKASSPTKRHSESRATLPLWYPPSTKSSAPSSPPRGRPVSGRAPKIDGKEFFLQARNKLSYEQFSAFLANIKELNAHRRSREETLKQAEEIFGTDNKDLYLNFHELLNRAS